MYPIHPISVLVIAEQPGCVCVQSMDRQYIYHKIQGHLLAKDIVPYQD